MRWILGNRCCFCGLYIKFWQRGKHETWHAEQLIEVTKLLCKPCFEFHGKNHPPCSKYPDCRCICNAFADNDGGE